jgi:hypothetical protein
MAAEFEDSYGDQNVDIEVKTLERGYNNKPLLSVVLTKVQSADDFVDAYTSDPREIELFFQQVREAEVEYRRLTLSDRP